jgi:hypothetical protein
MLSRRPSGTAGRTVVPLKSHGQTEGHIERLESLESIYGEATYARGFYLCRGRPRYVPASWAVKPISEYRLYHDARVPLTQVSDARKELFLLGDALDLRSPQDSNADVAATLHRAAAVSDDALHCETDWIHGRYVLLHRTWSGAWRALADAVGTRTVFHPVDGGSIGSHSSLVAVNHDMPAIRRAWGSYGFPGRTTSYDGVVALPPNHTLTVATGEISRFYPVEPLRTTPVKLSCEKAILLMNSAIKGLRHRFPSMVVSLTAGLDSRTTLAVTRPDADRLRFFTYFGSLREDAVDRLVAERLAEDLGLRHHVLHVGSDNSEVPTTFTDLCREHSLYLHHRRASYAYIKHFEPGRDVHLRSNMSEIGRAVYFRRTGTDDRLLSGADLARIYMAFKAPRNPPDFTEAERVSIERDFEDFFRSANYRAVLGLRHPRDMLYWEHRMGAWHSLILLHSDPAFQTVSLYNARVILDAMLAAPLKARAAGTVHKRIMGSSWPALLDYPINPKHSELASLCQR